MNTLSQCLAERDAAQRLVCLLAFEIAKLNKFLGEQHGKLRRAEAPCKHGDPSWEAGAVSDERRMDNHIRGSVRTLPPLTDTETVPPSRCQREAVRQHKLRNSLASPSAGE